MAKLEVKNLVLSVDDKITGNVKILKNINAVFESKKLNAVMGPSGSGKTTFLNILYGKCESHLKTSGTILYNDEERYEDEWFNIASYTEQDFYDLKPQTVRDFLKFFNKINPGVKKNYFDEIIENFQLESILDKMINVLSGGERKRTLVAFDLLMKRKVIIFDELTSDLDFRLASNITRYLRNIAIRDDLLIIMSVHQPSSQLFSMFDNLLFLYNGLQIYSGPTIELEPFLAKHDIHKPDDWSLSEFMFEVFSSTSHHDKIEQHRPNIRKLVKVLETSYTEKVDDSKYCTISKKFKLLEFSFSHVQELFKRQLIYDFGRRSCIMIILFAVVHFSYFAFDWNSINGSLATIMNQLLDYDSKVDNKEPLSISAKILKNVFISYPFYYLFSLTSSLDPRYSKQVNKEISKHYYGIRSIFVANLLFEVFCNSILSLILIIGYTNIVGIGSISLPLVLMIFSNGIFMAPFTILFNSLTMYNHSLEIFDIFINSLKYLCCFYLKSDDLLKAALRGIYKFVGPAFRAVVFNTLTANYTSLYFALHSSCSGFLSAKEISHIEAFFLGVKPSKLILLLGTIMSLAFTISMAYYTYTQKMLFSIRLNFKKNIK